MAVGSPCLKTATYTGPTRGFPPLFIGFDCYKNSEKRVYRVFTTGIQVWKRSDSVLMGNVV